MAKEPTFRGLIVVGILDYIKEKHGEAGLRELMDKFSPEEQKLLKIVMPVSKLQAPLLCKVYSHVINLWGNGKGEYYSQIMRYVAKSCLNSFMQYFIRIGTPGFVVHSAPLIWSHFFDEGRLIYLRGTDHSVELKSEGGEVYGPALCYGIIGFGQFAIEHSGGKNIRIDHDECIYKGKPSCIFKVEWDNPA